MFEGNLAVHGRLHEPREIQLPEDILQCVQILEDEDRRKSFGKKIAVFDLDNTLLIGDIGDAVFASLRQQGYVSGFSWSDYKRLLTVNKREAFTNVVASMKGFPETLVQRTTLDLLSKGGTHLECEKSFVPVPRAHPVMLRLVSVLRNAGYHLYVISASNEISARMTAWKLFGIPPFAVFGIRQRIVQGQLTDELLDPLPIDDGKVNVYRQFIGETAPVISAGDSYLDVPLLRLTDPRGLTIWVGEERVGYEVAQQKVGRSHKFCFLERPAHLEIDEKSPYA